MTRTPPTAKTERSSQHMQSNIDRERLAQMFRSVTRSNRNIQRSIRILSASGSVASDQIRHLMQRAQPSDTSASGEA